MNIPYGLMVRNTIGKEGLEYELEMASMQRKRSAIRGTLWAMNGYETMPPDEEIEKHMNKYWVVVLQCDNGAELMKEWFPNE